MCIFKFNPPAPGGPACKGCRKCPCVPRYWRLDVAAFNDFEDSSIVLQWDPVEGLEGPRYCYWHNRLDLLQEPDRPARPRPDTDFFAPMGWNLGTYASLPIGPTSLDPNVVFDRWVVFRPDVAYSRWPSAWMSGDPDLDIKEFYYFDCLGPNVFWYDASEGDHQGGAHPHDLNLPISMTLTPYYP